MIHSLPIYIQPLVINFVLIMILMSFNLIERTPNKFILGILTNYISFIFIYFFVIKKQLKEEGDAKG